MIKAVIFDFDDTIINTWKSSTKKHLEVAKSLGLTVPTEIEFGRLFGLPWEVAIKRTWPEITPDKFIEAFVQSDLKNEYTLVNNVSVVLGECKKLGLCLGIVTSRELKSLSKSINDLGLGINNFDYIQAEDQNQYKKPDPRVFDHLRGTLSDSHGIKENQILYVGDAIYDYRATKGTGLNFIAFLNGAWTKEEFIKEGLSERFIIKSLKELSKLIENWDKLEQDLGKYITI